MIPESAINQGCEKVYPSPRPDFGDLSTDLPVSGVQLADNTAAIHLGHIECDTSGTELSRTSPALVPISLWHQAHFIWISKWISPEEAIFNIDKTGAMCD